MTAKRNALASMSGYGRSEAVAGALRVTCELRTVNHRHLDVALSLPPALLEADPELRKVLAGALGRGRVDATIGIGASGTGEARPAMNLKLARWYGTRLAALARELKAPPPRAEAIAQLPGVISRTEAPRDLRPAAGLAKKALEAALGRLNVMRRREGLALGRDLAQRLDQVLRLTARLESEWPLAAARQRDRTEARLQQVLERLTEPGGAAAGAPVFGRGAAPPSAGRGAARDLVNAVERGDIAEELTRLRSHVDQFKEALAAGSPVGRKLDFLSQELHREVNTSGAKSADAALTGIVVELKEEVERIREQVQNIE